MTQTWTQLLAKYGLGTVISLGLLYVLVVDLRADLRELKDTQEDTNILLTEHVAATKTLIEQIAAWQNQIISGQQVSREIQQQQLSVARQICVSLADTQQERRDCAR